MNLLESENYNVVLKVFNNICDEWSLSALEKRAFEVIEVPTAMSLTVISRVFCIYASLHTIFADHHQANSWIRRENDALGLPAIELMKTSSGLEEVQCYLLSEIG